MYVYPFENLMNEGYSYLGEGDFSKAIELFSDAFTITIGDENKANALHGKGIALRLNCQFDESKDAFRAAISLVSSKSLIARIKRDFGMCYLDHGKMMVCDYEARCDMYDLAEEAFISSRDSLKSCGEYTEATVSDTFLARLYFLVGRKNDAVQIFNRSNEILRNNNATYELNNLVWLARASFVGRWRYAYRAIYLSVRIPAKRRWKEYMIILIGGNFLYEKIASKMRK